MKHRKTWKRETGWFFAAVWLVVSYFYWSNSDQGWANATSGAYVGLTGLTFAFNAATLGLDSFAKQIVPARWRANGPPAEHGYGQYSRPCPRDDFNNPPDNGGYGA